MHGSLPPRKSSAPSAYGTRFSTRSPFLQRLRRRNPRFLAIIGLGLFALFYILSKLVRGGSVSERIPYGTPPVVLVTTIDLKKNSKFNEAVKQNRLDYAARHGYTTFFPNTSAYPLANDPQSWSKIPAMRHAMTLFPHSTYFYYLDSHVLVMNDKLELRSHIMDKSRLESLMIVNIPVVPPDSVIKTFAHLQGDRIDMVLTQDHDGLSPSSFIIRRGEWAKYFLDAWFDPLYRSYNFQKAEGHALEHIVQWHGTVLAKLALIPQRIMNSYTKNDAKIAAKDGLYEEGDFVINFGECDKAGRSCEAEMQPFFQMLAERRDKK